MSEKTVRVCDVCDKVCGDVEVCCITVHEAGTEIRQTTIDLCAKHRTRLMSFIDRGCSSLKGAT